MGKVIWKFGNSDVTIEDIQFVENKLNYKLPKEFIKISLENDGGYPYPDTFFINSEDDVFNNLLSFKKDESSNLLDTYQEISDRLNSDSIIPFGEDPFGNYLCFDFRENKSIPKIVFFDHELEKNNILPISDNFEMFLNSLVTSDDM